MPKVGAVLPKTAGCPKAGACPKVGLAPKMLSGELPKLDVFWENEKLDALDAVGLPNVFCPNIELVEEAVVFIAPKVEFVPNIELVVGANGELALCINIDVDVVGDVAVAPNKDDPLCPNVVVVEGFCANILVVLCPNGEPVFCGKDEGLHIGCPKKLDVFVVVAGLPNMLLPVPNPVTWEVVVGKANVKVLVACVVVTTVEDTLGDKAETVKLPKLNLLGSGLDTANEPKPNVNSWVVFGVSLDLLGVPKIEISWDVVGVDVTTADWEVTVVAPTDIPPNIVFGAVVEAELSNDEVVVIALFPNKEPVTVVILLRNIVFDPIVLMFPPKTDEVLVVGVPPNIGLDVVVLVISGVEVIETVVVVWNGKFAEELPNNVPGEVFTLVSFISPDVGVAIALTNIVFVAVAAGLPLAVVITVFPNIDVLSPNNVCAVVEVSNNVFEFLFASPPKIDAVLTELFGNNELEPIVVVGLDTEDWIKLNPLTPTGGAAVLDENSDCVLFATVTAADLLKLVNNAVETGLDDLVTNCPKVEVVLGDEILTFDIFGAALDTALLDAENVNDGLFDSTTVVVVGSTKLSFGLVVKIVVIEVVTRELEFCEIFMVFTAFGFGVDIWPILKELPKLKVVWSKSVLVSVCVFVVEVNSFEEVLIGWATNENFGWDIALLKIGWDNVLVKIGWDTVLVKIGLLSFFESGEDITILAVFVLKLNVIFSGSSHNS